MKSVKAKVSSTEHGDIISHFLEDVKTEINLL